MQNKNFGDFNNWLKHLLVVLNYSKESGFNYVFDKRIFNIDDNNIPTSFNKNFLESINTLNFVFIGDNPGKNEKEYKRYFYVDLSNQEWCSKNKSTAGWKMHKLLERCDKNNKEHHLFFNKCFITTDKTNGLTRKAIEQSQELTISFLQLIKNHNDNIKFIFMGMNKKFDDYYKEAISRLRSGRNSMTNLIIVPHPCRSLYKYKNKKVESTGSLLDYFNYWQKDNIAELERYQKDNETFYGRDDDDGEEGNDSSPSPVSV